MTPPKVNNNTNIINRKPQQNQPIANNNQQGFSTCTYFLIGLLIFVLISNILPLFLKPNTQQLLDIHQRNPNMVMNSLSSGDKLNVAFAIVNQNQVINSDNRTIQYTSDQTPIQINIDVPLSNSSLTQNLTIHVQVSVVKSKLFSQGRIIMRAVQNFTKYKTIKKDNPSLSQDPTVMAKNKRYETRIPDTFNIMFLYCESYFNSVQQLKQIMKMVVQINTFKANGKRYYEMPLDLSQLHVTNKHYHTVKQNQNVTIQIYPYSFTKFSMFSGFSKHQQTSEVMPSFMADMYNDDSMNQLKQIVFENNIILVSVTFILSILQTIFQFLSVKNDIKIWKNISQHKGLSLKGLYTSLGISIVFLLYLIDNDATQLLIIFEIVGIFVTIWKIFKTTQFTSKKSFPYFKMTYPSWYSSDLQTHDSAAIKYLYYFLIPLFICYSGYKLYTDAYTSMFSFVLESLVGFIYIFGFVQMTPQIYINYKLKSVAHLPWRSLIYKFINTIIDDLFAFMVTMPWLKRLDCFKDDIIFLVYIYQRIIYRTDYNRVGRVDYVSEQTTTTEKLEVKQD